MLVYRLAGEQVHSDSIIVYGKSIGTGIAAYVAANSNCRQLILETPYYSMKVLAGHYFPIYPVNSLIKYSFPVHYYLKKVQAPITVFHGTKDEVVPYKHSRWLKEENKNIELITIENGKHNNLSAFDPVSEKDGFSFDNRINWNDKCFLYSSLFFQEQLLKFPPSILQLISFSQNADAQPCLPPAWAPVI